MLRGIPEKKYFRHIAANWLFSIVSNHGTRIWNLKGWMDDRMTEQNSSASELKNGEMARVSGGLTQQPHCPGCGHVVVSFGNVYKCTTKGCKFEGRVMVPTMMLWK